MLPSQCSIHSHGVVTLFLPFVVEAKKNLHRIRGKFSLKLHRHLKYFNSCRRTGVSQPWQQWSGLRCYSMTEPNQWHYECQ